jgi:hypothetical protein
MMISQLAAGYVPMKVKPPHTRIGIGLFALHHHHHHHHHQLVLGRLAFPGPHASTVGTISTNLAAAFQQQQDTHVSLP